MDNKDNNKTLSEADMATKDLTTQKFSLSKSIYFTFIIVTIFFGGLEIVLALIGVHPILLTEDPLVGFSGNVPLYIEEHHSDGSIILKTANNKLNYFNYQEFPKEKDPKSYRIFCMGGSTTYGRPYLDKVSFCGWLRAFLKNADSNRKLEIINAGGVSYASYRVTKLMNELKQYKPDMFIIYSGQNEFLEHRSYGDLLKLPSWILNLDSLLSRTRTYAATKNLLASLRSMTHTEPQKRYMLTDEVDEILTHTTGPSSYHRDEKLQQQIITHYRLNLELMLNIAHEAGSKIIFVEPASNLKDMSPFKSEHKERLDNAMLNRWQKIYDRASSLHKTGKFKDALAIYRKALRIDDRYAELHYRAGQVLYELSKFPQAKKAFGRAIDEDIAPLRMLSSMHMILEDVASWNNVPLVDFPGIAQEAYLREYKHSIFGKECFSDHVHANIEGYRLLGLALFNKLKTLGIVTPTNSWNKENIEAVRQQVMATQDKHAQGLALRNLGKVRDWSGKFDQTKKQSFAGTRDIRARPEWHFLKRKPLMQFKYFEVPCHFLTSFLFFGMTISFYRFSCLIS